MAVDDNTNSSLVSKLFCGTPTYVANMLIFVTEKCTKGVSVSEFSRYSRMDSTTRGTMGCCGCVIVVDTDGERHSLPSLGQSSAMAGISLCWQLAVASCELEAE